MALKQVMAAYKGCVYAFVGLTDGSLYVANVSQTNPIYADAVSTRVCTH